MSTYNLDKIFAPRSLALVGVGARDNSVGHMVLRNVRAAGFEGGVHVVHPREPMIDDIACARSLSELPSPVDLVIVSTPPEAVPALIEEAGAKGCGAAIVLTAGLGRGEGSFSEATRQAARRHSLRVVGPNCIGVLAPASKLNASFAARNALPGSLALISQSGAVAAGILEWAAGREIGFSAIATIGDKLDVDFGDCLDYFAADGRTSAILLYIEAIGDPRKFMSAARAAARLKPVIVLKAGRHASGAKAAATHTGALAGSDAVYDAAFRRAGLLRVFSLDEMFAAAETLSHVKPFAGDRLAILTNGGGIGVMGMDRLEDMGLPAATLSDDTLRALDTFLPATWSRANPVDIIGDAGPERYAASLETLLRDPGVAATLVSQVPTALAIGVDSARAVVDVIKRERCKHAQAKPVFAAWIGADKSIRAIFDAACVPNFQTETEAIAGIGHIIGYSRAQERLMSTPPDYHETPPDTGAARAIVTKAIERGERWLDPVEINQLLAAYGVPVVPIALAADANAAVEAARPLIAAGQRVALKILSPDIVHKSDIGGVALDLATETAVEDAANAILTNARARRPDARISGVMVQAMIRRPRGRELIMGVANDPTFGPVMAFGAGGTAVEVLDDKAIGLPPLDLKLARELIMATRVSRLLRAYRDVPAADMDAIARTLVQLSRLVADIGEIVELDLNPVLADADGVVVLDARVAVAASGPHAGAFAGNPRLAIRPYPREWERDATLANGAQVHFRPVRPEDEKLIGDMLSRVTPEDLRMRFFSTIVRFSHAFLARLTQLDYARAMAFIAIGASTGDALGVVRIGADANHERGEYAVLARSDAQGIGLGWAMMRLIIEWANADGLQYIEGQVLGDNIAMLRMCRELGFEIKPDPHEHNIQLVSMALRGGRPGAA